MSQRSLPFNGTTYDAADTALLNSTLTGNGIRVDILDEYDAAHLSGMTARVESGSGWVQGYLHISTTPVDFTLAAGHASFDRIDTIVLRLNLTGAVIDGQDTDTVELAVVQGTPSGTPAAPTLVQTTTRFELPLWNVTVSTAAVSLAFATFTDRRVSGGTLTVITMSDMPVGITPVQLGINNGFENAQRVSLPVSTHLARGHDGWTLTIDTGDTMTVNTVTSPTMPDSRNAAIIAVTIVSTNSLTRYYEHLSIVSGEPHHGLRGHKVSLRLSVKQQTATPSAVRAFMQHDGTGAAQYFSSYHGANTSWEDLTIDNVTVPLDATYLRYGVAFSAGTALFVQVDNVMPVMGTESVPYVYEHPAVEMAKCERYYEIIYPGRQGYAGAAMTDEVTLPYRSVKPVSPTVTRNGSFGTSNVTGQPSSIVRGDDKRCMSFFATIPAAGAFFWISGGSTVFFSIEANP